jgi:hypothetical protein
MALIDMAKVRATRAGGYRRDIDRQPTCRERFFHRQIRLAVLRKPMVRKAVMSSSRFMTNKSSWLINTVTVYKEYR